MVDHCHCWICLCHSTAGFLCAFFQWTKDLSGTKHFLKVLWYCDPITLSHLLWEKSCSLIACFFFTPAFYFSSHTLQRKKPNCFDIFLPSVQLSNIVFTMQKAEGQAMFQSVSPARVHTKIISPLWRFSGFAVEDCCLFQHCPGSSCWIICLLLVFLSSRVTTFQEMGCPLGFLYNFCFVYSPSIFPGGYLHMELFFFKIESIIIYLRSLSDITVQTLELAFST